MAKVRCVCVCVFFFFLCQVFCLSTLPQVFRLKAQACMGNGRSVQGLYMFGTMEILDFQESTFSATFLLADPYLSSFDSWESLPQKDPCI